MPIPAAFRCANPIFIFNNDISRWVEEIDLSFSSGQIDDYEIFMAEVHAVGHDKRGNRLYHRNEDGEEVLFQVEEMPPGRRSH